MGLGLSFVFLDISDFVEDFMIASASGKDALDIVQPDVEETLDDVEADVEELATSGKYGGKIEIPKTFEFGASLSMA